MLIISADPIAESIAEHIAGSKNEFVKMMKLGRRNLGQNMRLSKTQAVLMHLEIKYHLMILLLLRKNP